ncbi:DUF6192 family protein [Streptomyces sp. 900105755]
MNGQRVSWPARPAAGADVQTLARFADDVGVSTASVMNYRHTAAHWSPRQRVKGVSLDVHRILTMRPERFELIRNPPFNPHYRTRRWTQDVAKREVGWRVVHPASVQERVTAIHGLAVDDQVAARVAAELLQCPAVAAGVPVKTRIEAIGDLAHDEQVAVEAATRLLHRPDVAFRVMGDDRARNSVNYAQVETRPPGPRGLRADQPGPASSWHVHRRTAVVTCPQSPPAPAMASSVRSQLFPRSSARPWCSADDVVDRGSDVVGDVGGRNAWAV